MISTIRHKEIFDAQVNDHGITIIGAGAIGSRVFATLVELGLKNIEVYDPDIVEAHNLANQLYRYDDIGQFKVNGLVYWAQEKLGVNSLPNSMNFYSDYFDANTPAHSTVFLLVDSLQSRHDIVVALSNRNNVVRVIDVRMAATHGNVFTFSPIMDIDAYLSTIGSDEEAEVSACGSPFSVSPTAAILSNLAVWQYINDKTNPEARDKRVNVFLKPLTISTGNL